MSWRHLLGVGLILVVLTLVLGGTGVTASVWHQSLQGRVPSLHHELIAPEDAAPMTVLIERSARLNAENIELRRRLREYESIRGEGGIFPEQAVVARVRVIGRSERRGRRYVEVDVGALDGVRRGQAVISGWSLLGEVVGEQRRRSLVRLITSEDSRVAAALYDPRGQLVAEGILRGDPSGQGCRLLYIEDHPDLVVEAGMEVLTSGTGGRFRAGLLLGLVTDVERPSDSDHWTVWVEPVHQPNRLPTFQIADLPPLTQTPAH
jgi:rod shape-determining protein MreC